MTNYTNSYSLGNGDSDYDVSFTVTEPRRVAGGISTLVGTNDGSLVSITRREQT